MDSDRDSRIQHETEGEDSEDRNNPGDGCPDKSFLKSNECCSNDDIHNLIDLFLKFCTKLSGNENCILIKDFVQFCAGKTTQIEDAKAKKYLFTDTEFVDLTELCSDIKSEVTKLYIEIASVNFAPENEAYDSDYPSIVSVEKELDLVIEEFSQIVSTQEVGKYAGKGTSFLKIFRREFDKVKQIFLKQDAIINDLMSAICARQDELKEQEKVIHDYKSKSQALSTDKDFLENELKICRDKVVGLGKVLSMVNTDVDLETVNLSNLVDSVVQGLSQKVQQYCHLTSYVKDLENQHLSPQNKNFILAKEVDILKENLLRIQNHSDKINQFLNLAIPYMPHKISSIEQAMEAAKQVFFEYKTLKEKERTVFDEQKADQDKLAIQIESNTSLEKLNSDLKVQLETYEIEIRNLRSELRNLRRKERSRVIKKEQEVQTVTKSSIEKLRKWNFQKLDRTQKIQVQTVKPQPSAHKTNESVVKVLSSEVTDTKCSNEPFFI